MMSTPLPPIYRDIRRLLVHTEEMVRRFARYHKYTVGTDLRTQAMRMMRGVNRACFDTAQSGRVGTFLCPRGFKQQETKPRGQTITLSAHPTASRNSMNRQPIA